MTAVADSSLVAPLARLLPQGLTGALLGGLAASAAYALLTRHCGAPRHVARPAKPWAPARSAALATVPAPGSGSAATARARCGRGRPLPGGNGGGPSGDVAPPSRDPWLRTNFRGRGVTLRQGPALACGVCAASLFVPGPQPRVRAAFTLATAGAAVFGVYDDLVGTGRVRGLRGHLGALARGRVTSGLVKMAGIGATGVCAARVLGRSGVDTVVDGALIAASANLFNLFDLRPGRAVKVALITAVPALASPAAPLLGPVVGASAALLPDELAERSMLGDAGANALGAALGAAATGASRATRLALLAGVAALTLASERVSFSGVIERVPALRRLDLWGRHE